MSGRSALIVVARGMRDRDFEDKVKKHVLGDGAVLEEYRVKAQLHAAARPEIST